MPKAAESFLFDFFTKAATKTFADCADVFVCSLCLQTFGSLSDLSRAHLWPEALGGRIFTLACRKCNSEVGSAIERHEVQRVNYFSRNRIPFRQQVDGVEGDIGGLFSIDYIDNEPTVILEISDKNSNPKTLSRQNEAFKTGEILTRQARWTFPTGYNHLIAPLTYLHFAYMTLFHLTGYSWISTALAKYIRQQLKCPKEATFPIHLISFTDNETDELADSIEPILFEIATPTQLKGYLVATPALRHEGGQRKAIWIPRFFDDAYKVGNLNNFQGIDFNYQFLASIGRKPGQFAMQERLIK